MSNISLSRPHWLLQLLQGPAALATDVECIETHISWVLLAGEHAFKFKKPLKLDFLDFSTLEQRRLTCLEELRINRRTAPQLYQTVVAVVGPAEAPRLVALADVSAPELAQVIDYGVQMQRFGSGQLLAQQLAAGTLDSAHLTTLAARVAQLHAAADVAPSHTDWGSAVLVQIQAQMNLETLAALPLQSTERRTLEALSHWTQQEGDRLDSLITQRKITHHVRECHGDLHLGNLVLLADGPQLFDAIEFSDSLRWIDVIADVAFLCMDLQAQGRPDLAWHFLNNWLEHSGDYEGLALLPWYLVYRALVRAMVAGLRWQQAPDDTAREASLQELRRYLTLAEQLSRPRPRWLWLAHGVSGSGKSRHSAQLMAQRSMVRLRADVERKRLFGLAATEISAKALPDVPGGIYTTEATQRTYDRLATQAAQVLEAGFAVLVDATFLTRPQRAKFVALAAQQQVPCQILAFDAPVEVLRERVLRRAQKENQVSEATLEVLEAQLAHREPLDAAEQALAVPINTTQPIDWPTLLP